MAYKNRLCLKQEVAIMANEDKKDFNAMLHDSKDMPKFQTTAMPIRCAIVNCS